MQPPTPGATPPKTLRNMLWMILPVLLVVAVIGMIVFFVQMRGPTLSFIFPGVALFSMVGMAMYGMRGLAATISRRGVIESRTAAITCTSWTVCAMSIKRSRPRSSNSISGRTPRRLG